MVLKPLSFTTYYRRHKFRALLLLMLIALVTLGIYFMVGFLNSIGENFSANNQFLTRFSLVSSQSEQSLDPAVVSRVKTHPAVSRVLPENGVVITPPALASSGSFHLFGVSEGDAQYLLDLCGVHLEEGRLFKSHANEVVLSEDVAKMLNVQIGDPIGRSVNESYYANLPTELVVVGILKTDSPSIRLGFVSYGYLVDHELYAPRKTGFVVVPQDGRKDEVDSFLETTILSEQVAVQTYHLHLKSVRRTTQSMYLLFSTVSIAVSTVLALAVGMMNRIALIRRGKALGMLHAIGQSRGRLVRCLTLEMSFLAFVGWGIGLAFSWMGFVLLKTYVYAPRGWVLNVADLRPAIFTIPTPLIITVLVFVVVVRMLTRLDAIAIIERGDLGVRQEKERREAKRVIRKPLSALTFYRRHKLRGAAMVGAMILMILGIAFMVFLISPIGDARMFTIQHLRRLSIVSPKRGDSLDPMAVSQVKANPDVSQAIPVRKLGLSVMIPPFSDTVLNVYGVSESILPDLIDLYGAHLEKGRLPKARTNEIVLSAAVAQNRGLQLGDCVGEPIHRPYDRGIPTEMTLVGILESDEWLGFASYEYLDSHEHYSSNPVSLIIVPAEGCKSEVDLWLEQNIASEQTWVETFDSRERLSRQFMQGIVMVFALAESVIAVVVTIAIGMVNYVYFIQRRKEFGILHTLGLSRRRLILRAVLEAAALIALAWLISAAICLSGMLLAQAKLYAPSGLSLNVLNPTPWLFTLPIPFAAILVVAATVAWMFFRLDSVSVIERR